VREREREKRDHSTNGLNVGSNKKREKNGWRANRGQNKGPRVLMKIESEEYRKGYLLVLYEYGCNNTKGRKPKHYMQA
jgi:hypothetical protein